MTPYMHRVPQWGWLLTLALLTTSPGVAQRINFGAYTTSRDLSLLKSGDLDFNAKQPLIASGSNATVTIALTDAACQWIGITGDATRDITIAITADPYLTVGAGGPGSQIPFACKFAYSNLGVSDASSAKTYAIQVPIGFSSITLPMLRRTSGAPLPPPTPAHGGYTAPSAKAYLFIYGTLGPVGNVAAGSYSGTINVIVEY
jgi:spore coat protein U-like protein